MGNRDEELCEEGSTLWHDLFGEYSNSKYRLYVDHIRSCKECKHGLEIDDIITKEELMGEQDEQ